MKIDQSKLKNVVRKVDGKITAQCPACAAEGGDAKGDHLVVFKDGKFGCVLHEGDKAHNRAILKLAGVNDRADGSVSCRLSVVPMRVKDSTVLMKVGRLGRVKPSPEEKTAHASSGERPAGDSKEADAVQPKRPDPVPAPRAGIFIIPRSAPEITDEDLRRFLDLPFLAA